MKQEISHCARKDSNTGQSPKRTDLNPNKEFL